MFQAWCCPKPQWYWQGCEVTGDMGSTVVLSWVGQGGHRAMSTLPPCAPHSPTSLLSAAQAACASDVYQTRVVVCVSPFPLCMHMHTCEHTLMRQHAQDSLLLCHGPRNSDCSNIKCQLDATLNNSPVLTEPLRSSWCGRRGFCVGDSVRGEGEEMFVFPKCCKMCENRSSLIKFSPIGIQCQDFPSQPEF